MNTVTIFNSWDTAAHAFNGLDKDSDSLLTTNNSVILRNTRELESVVCIQKTAQRKIVTEEDLILSNKNGFGDEIGSTTNRITGMIDVAASFDKNSDEYKELHQNCNLPEFVWIKTIGIAGKDEFGLSKSHRLVISSRILSIFNREGIKNYIVKEYKE
jgi:hypothetical protein